jgi:hypothetical protein
MTFPSGHPVQSSKYTQAPRNPPPPTGRPDTPKTEAACILDIPVRTHKVTQHSLQKTVISKTLTGLAAGFSQRKTGFDPKSDHAETVVEVGSCGICGGQSDIGTSFFHALRFPLHSSHSTIGSIFNDRPTIDAILTASLNNELKEQGLTYEGQGYI